MKSGSQAFDGQTVYMTGGSSGIGLAIAKVMAAQGAHLVLIARRPDKLQAAQSALERLRGRRAQRIATVPLDVADHGAVERTMAQAIASFGAPDILVNSAGTLKHANHFRHITYDQFDEVIRVNLYGVRNVTHALLDALQAQRGHIVILSSFAGLSGMFGYTAYGASKAALVGFAESLRYEVKPMGISVSLVCPAEVATPMLDDEVHTLPAEGRAMKNLPGRLDPDRVAHAVVDAIRKRRFWVMPGIRAPFMFLLHRLSNGRITRAVADAVVRRAVRR